MIFRPSRSPFPTISSRHKQARTHKRLSYSRIRWATTRRSPSRRGDHVTLNGATEFPLPERTNNSVPENPDLLVWGIPYTVRVPLGAIAHEGPSPLAVGDNTFQFFAENTGILDVHIEIDYPPGSAPPYTPPRDDPRISAAQRTAATRPPARFEQIGDTQVDGTHHMTADPPRTHRGRRQCSADPLRRRQPQLCELGARAHGIPGAKHRNLERGRHGRHRERERVHSPERRRRDDESASARACNRARRADAARPLHPEFRQHGHLQTEITSSSYKRRNRPDSKAIRATATKRTSGTRPIFRVLTTRSRFASRTDAIADDSTQTLPHRHPGEGRDPFCFVVRRTRSQWIPAFAGMTAWAQYSRDGRAIMRSMPTETSATTAIAPSFDAPSVGPLPFGRCSLSMRCGSPSGSRSDQSVRSAT